VTITTMATAGEPIRSTLARFDPTRDGLQVENEPLGDGWLRAADIDDPETLAVLVALTERQTGSSSVRLLGPLILWRYATPAIVATLAYARERRIPDLDPATVWFRPFDGTRPTGVVVMNPRFACPPDDPDAAHATAVPMTAPLLRQALARTVEAFIAPAIDPVSEATRIGPKALWGIAAAATLLPMVREMATRDAREAIEEVNALLVDAGGLGSSPPQVKAEAGDGIPALKIRFGACCLAYRWPVGEGTLCDACPIRRGREPQ
jgi:hypothetical protein